MHNTTNVTPTTSLREYLEAGGKLDETRRDQLGEVLFDVEVDRLQGDTSNADRARKFLGATETFGLDAWPSNRTFEDPEAFLAERLQYERWAVEIHENPEIEAMVAKAVGADEAGRQRLSAASFVRPWALTVEHRENERCSITGAIVSGKVVIVRPNNPDELPYGNEVVISIAAYKGIAFEVAR